MLLQFLFVLFAAGLNNAQFQNPVHYQKYQMGVLGAAAIGMAKNPTYGPPLLENIYSLAQLPNYQAKVNAILVYLRHPMLMAPEIPLTPNIVSSVFNALQNPHQREHLLNAIFHHLAVKLSQLSPNSMQKIWWPSFSPSIEGISKNVIQVLQHPALFDVFAHQLAHLMQDASLEKDWLWFIFEMGKFLDIRRAGMDALLAIMKVQEAKRFVVHGIVLSLQRQDMRPLFMKQFLEMLLSRTIPENIALQIIRVLYTPMPEEQFIPMITEILDKSRVSYRISAIALNILFDPKIQATVVAAVLETLRHPMFYPVLHYHTKQILQRLMKNPKEFDYAIGLMQSNDGRRLAIRIFLLFLKQPVQVDVIDYLAEHDVRFRKFYETLSNDPAIHNVVQAITMVKVMLNTETLLGELAKTVAKLLDNWEVREYVASYLLVLIQNPSYTPFFEQVLGPQLIGKIQQIVREANEANRWILTIEKQNCIRNTTLENPQPIIPIINPMPPPHPPPPTTPPMPPPMPPPFPPPYPILPIPTPPPNPHPSPNPPWSVIHLCALAISGGPNGGITVIITHLISLAHHRQYDRIHEIMTYLLQNPLTQNQAITQISQQKELMPILLDVLDRLLDDPNMPYTLPSALITSFRKLAQDTVVFRDILATPQILQKLVKVINKLAPMRQHSEELQKFYVDFAKNSGVDISVQHRVVLSLSRRGSSSPNFGDIIIQLTGKDQ